MYFCFFFFRKDRRRVKKVGEEKKKPIFVLCRTTPIIAKPFFTLHAHLNSLFFFFYKFDWKRLCNGKWRISLLLFTIQTLCVYFISWSFYPLKTRGGEQKSISNIYWVAPPPSFPLYCCWLRPYFFFTNVFFKSLLDSGEKSHHFRVVATPFFSFSFFFLGGGCVWVGLPSLFLLKFKPFSFQVSAFYTITKWRKKRRRKTTPFFLFL